MKILDLITAVQIILGSVCGVFMIILFIRNKSTPKVWPRIFGVGGGVFMFVLSMVTSMLSRPIFEFVDYTIPNLMWTFVIGIMGYFGGRMIARRFE